MKPPPPRHPLETLGKVVLGAAILGGLALVVVEFMEGDAKPKKHVLPTITTVKLPPPPPPPPPKVEPPKIEEPKVKAPDPIKPEIKKPEPVQAPPPSGLGFEGDGGPGAYGDIGVAGSGTGIGWGSGGNGGTAQAYYASVIIRHVQDALQRHEKTRNEAFRLVVKLWVGARGSIERVELVSSSGDARKDAAIASALKEVVFSEAPPPDLPQPVQVRIDARRPS